jgi:methyl-accepting chemotaxis protein
MPNPYNTADGHPPSQSESRYRSLQRLSPTLVMALAVAVGNEMLRPPAPADASSPSATPLAQAKTNQAITPILSLSAPERIAQANWTVDATPRPSVPTSSFSTDPMVEVDASADESSDLSQKLAAASISQSEGASHSDFMIVFTTTVVLMAIGAGSVVLYAMRRLSTHLRDLAGAVEQLSSGNLDVALPPRGIPQTQTLAKSINHLAMTVKHLTQEQTVAIERARLLATMTTTRALTQADVESFFSRALADSRRILGVDRIVIYRFRADYSGYISNESVASNWTRALNANIEDPCIPEELLEAYRNDRVVVNHSLSNANFHPKHLQLLEDLQVKANLVVPVLHEGQLFGLLIAHHCARAHQWKETEVSFLRQLATLFGVTIDRLKFVQEREAQVEQSKFLREMILEIMQPQASEAVLAGIPLAKIRQELKADRVLIYRFDEDWKGTITAESVDPRFPKALGAKIYDPCFEKDYVEKYQLGRVQATSNIQTAGLTTCHLNQLEPFSVKANLVAPILQGGKLLGLLIAHQCSQPRQWETGEIELFRQIAYQVGIALDRCQILEQKETAVEQARVLAEEQRQQKEALRELLTQKEAAVSQARILAEEQRQQKEALRKLLKQKEAAVAKSRSLAEEQRQQKELLQRQFMTLLSSVEDAAMGDLTVRAEVTEGEVGTVADFFNSIVESLRQIVTGVKDSAIQVSEAIDENESDISQLATIAIKQADKITRVLDSVEHMTRSIQIVSESAQQAAHVADKASFTAEVGGKAMDRTVESILGLREMIGDTAKKMKRLSESSQQISKVISLIEKIALQTNLLAINAGIEAARAGEEGKGFAVVAEEVGELAAKSASAAKEVEEIIASIQFETNQVVEAMEQSTAQVVTGTRQVEETKRSLHQILTVSDQINDLVKSISQATVSQMQTSHEVVYLMQEVAAESKLTSDSSTKVSQSLRRTVAIAQELQASVGTFKVEQS